MTGSGSREALPRHRWDSGLQGQLESWRPVRPPHWSRLCGDRRWPWCGEKEGWPRLPGGDCWRARAGARGLWLTPQGAVATPALCPPGRTTAPCRDFVWCRHAVLTGSELGSPLCCHGHGTLWFKGFSHPPPHSAPPEPCEVGSAGISMLEMKRPRRDTVGRAD